MGEHCLISPAIKLSKDHNLDLHLLQDARLPYNPQTASPSAQPLPILTLAPQVPALVTSLAEPPHPQSTLASTYLTSPTQLALTRLPHTSLLEYRNTQPIFNVIFVRRNSLVHTTCDHIYARTLMSDLSFVLYARKHSHANTIANAMKGCILARRSSSVEASFTPCQARCGDVAAVLLVPMLLADTSDLKRVGYALNRFSMKSVQNGTRR